MTIHNHASCLGCGSKRVELGVDFGKQPPCNRFVDTKETESIYEDHSLIIGQCIDCGLVQLLDYMPASMVRSHYKWLSYNEPEGHLDETVHNLTKYLDKKSRIVGMTYKDDSTLSRFQNLGYDNVLRYDMKDDLGIDIPLAGLETIQNIFNNSLVDKLLTKYGAADLLIVRHVLEHAHDPSGLLQSLKQLLDPKGVLVVEVPDSNKFIDSYDYSFVWEEHISYFLPSTLVDIVNRNGFNDIELLRYSYPYEDSLVAILQLEQDSYTTSTDYEVLQADITKMRMFYDNFNMVKSGYREKLSNLMNMGNCIAIFGAGHLAAKFINFFELVDYIEFVIDDNPHKQDLLMPGSGVPIVGSNNLLEVDLCLLALSPESEKVVQRNYHSYLEKGGVFASIFRLSPISLSNI